MSVKIGSCSITHSGCRTTVCAADGFEISFSSIGAGIQRVRVPVSGTLRDTVLSFKNPELYTPNSLYAGATLAPTAGRITAGSFSVNGKPHPLAANENGTVNLHGGPENASFAEWEASAPVMTDDGRIRLAYSIQLPDGLCGFPGNRNLTVIYTVGPDHTLLIEYEGVSDRDTYL
ncbi:MAG: hypothetical protein Q4B09_09980, partial [Lachnospiraceae bacterium]|nr:hypothetical protein [Lachnospiraceae bacterium]